MSGCNAESTPPGSDRVQDQVIRCDEDIDCPSESSHCGLDGICHQCEQDRHCPLEAPACQKRSCAPCTSDASCDGRGRCSQATGACVQCLDGEDCPSGICEDQRCAEGVACSSEHRCEGGQVCFFSDSSSDSGLCKEPCSAWEQTGCEGDELCALASFDEERQPVGACVDPIGGRRAGEDCDEQNRCEVNLVCVNRLGYSTCLSFCSELGGSCEEGLSCLGLPVNGGGGTMVQLCGEEERPCARDQDCAQGESCAAMAPKDGGAEQACVKSLGAKGGGESCRSADECGSGSCFSGLGLCFGACTQDEDCGSGGSCVEMELGSGASAITLTSCVRGCERDGQCLPSEACGYGVSASELEWEGFCAHSQGKVESGERCARTENCRSGGCWKASGGQGYCAGTCAGDDDCGANTECTDHWYLIDAGGDRTVGTPDDTFRPLGQCQGQRCDHNADCAEGWECLPHGNGARLSDFRMELRCIPSANTSRGGTACTEDCTCITSPILGSYCYEACTSDDDCLAAATCVPSSVTFKADGGSAKFSSCLPR